MSTGRVLWIIFCCAMAAFWITLGWVFLPVFNVLLAGGSLLAILCPVGKPAAAYLPPPPPPPGELGEWSSVYRRDFPGGKS